MRSSTASIAAFLLVCACSDKVDPALVEPADGTTDSALPTDAPTGPTTAPDTTAPDTHEGGGNPNASGIWVEDANGASVGMLVRRGSDDQVAGRTIYDIVTVYHPVSGLFFEITMTDGTVRLPQNTYFQDANCTTPMGIGIGTCQDCKSGYGTGFLHKGKWYRVVGGVDYSQMGPDGLMKGGLSTECVAHGTGTAKGYPVQAVSGDQPPFTFAAPLRFVAR